MTVDHALTILTANAEWAAGVDVVRHYEDAAEAFYRDTGIMAPGKSRPLGWPDAGDDDRLAWATWCKARAVERLEAVRLLRAELAEALATLANERGEGEPPCEGWIPLLEVEGDIEEGNVCVTRWACAMADGIVCYAGVNAFVGGAWWALHRKVERRTVFLLTGDVDTVRNAMRAASAAKGGAR